MMKKKSFLMLIAATTVVCAVICAAGCISTDEEEDASVLGTWYCGDDSFKAVVTLAEDNTGVLIAIRDDDDRAYHPGSLPYTHVFTWSVDGNKITYVFENGFARQFTFDEKTGFLIDGDYVFEPVDLAGEEGEEHFVWYYEDESCSEISIDLADGTGVAYSLDVKTDKDGKPTGELTGSTETYIWAPNAEGTEDLTTYSDGTLEHNIYGDDYTTLISDRRGGIVYDLMPDTTAAFACMLAWAADKLA